MDTAKNEIKQNKNSQTQINQLQQQINNLKQKEETNADSKLTQFYQDQIDKLKMQIMHNKTTRTKTK